MTVIAFPTPQPDDNEPTTPPPPAAHPWGAARLAPMPPTGQPDDDLDDNDTPAPAATHATYAQELTEPGERRPVVAPWLRDRSQRRAAARWWVSHVAHVIAFHLLRIPLYWLRAARRSPHGLGRSLVAIGRWIIDTRSRDERDALAVAVRADSRGAPQLENAAKRHRRNVQVRLALFATGVLAGLVGGLFLLAINWLAALGTAATGLAALGVIGRPLDKPLTSWAVSKDETPRLTPDLIISALGVLGIGTLNQALKGDDRAVRFVSPVTRSGDGFRVDLDLPPGVTAAQVVERRSALASALRRHMSQVWPSPDPDAHEGRLIIYVADKPMAVLKPRPWPLATKGKVDLFEPFPIGVDERGVPILLALAGRGAGTIAAIPRMGKTFILRLLALAAALDPRVKLYLYGLKGGSDLRPLKALAHVYRSGDSLEDIKGALSDLKALQDEMRRRYDLIETLPTDVCPESKVTTEMASVKANGMEPVFVGVDECQVWFEHPEHGKELEAITTDLVKRGPAVAIMVYLATQRPDGKSLPTGIRDNAAIQICLKVNSPEANNMALGAGSYAAGYQATAFSTKDKGVGWVKDEDYRICRFHYIDAPLAEAIVARAKAARERAGWPLTGMAAGEIEPDSDEGIVEGVLDHVTQVWPLGQPKVWAETLAERLAERWPTLYSGWGASQVTSALKPLGVPRIQVWGLDAEGEKANRGGFSLEAIGEALERRDAQEGEG